MDGRKAVVKPQNINKKIGSKCKLNNFYKIVFNCFSKIFSPLDTRYEHFFTCRPPLYSHMTKKYQDKFTKKISQLRR